MSHGTGDGTQRELFGLPVDALTMDQAIARCTEAIDHGQQLSIGVINAAKVVSMQRNPQLRQAVVDNLVADIRKHGNHVTAGDIGFHFLVQALTDAGRSDVLYDMLSRTDAPSYGYQLKMGATALTEAWDANPNSSQNHFMLGHAEEWFYGGLAGIRFDLSDNEGERIRIKPFFAGNIASAEGSYRSVLGNISSRWNRDGSRVALDVTIPTGEMARVDIPATRDITESGVQLDTANGVKFSVTQTETICHIGSGHYHFVWQSIQ